MEKRIEQKVAKSFDIILEMLADRGVTIGTTSGEITDFLKSQKNKSTFKIELNTEYDIIYHISPKINIKDLKEIFSKDIEENKLLTFLVLLNKPNGNDIIKINKVFGDEYQLFTLSELQFNITKHVLVPKHEIIRNTDEVRKIFDEHSIQHGTQLPLILKTDPVAKWLYAKPGDLIRITRPSQTSGTYFSYRYCV